jgi:hypothetical protein
MGISLPLNQSAAVCTARATIAFGGLVGDGKESAVFYQVHADLGVAGGHDENVGASGLLQGFYDARDWAESSAATMPLRFLPKRVSQSDTSCMVLSASKPGACLSKGLDLGGVAGELGDGAEAAGKVRGTARSMLDIGDADFLGAGVALAEFVGEGAGKQAELAEVVRSGPGNGIVHGRCIRQGVEQDEGDAGLVDLAGLLGSGLGIERDQEDHVGLLVDGLVDHLVLHSQVPVGGQGLEAHVVRIRYLGWRH